MKSGDSRVVRMPPGQATASSDVDREMQFHLDLLQSDLVAGGMSPEAAQVEAGRRFGDQSSVRAECVTIEGSRQEEVRRREVFTEVRQDVRYAVRTLRRAPSFTAAAVLTLAFGLGVTIAMFSVVDAVMLRALPIPNADQVVAIEPRLPDGPMNGSPALYLRWREESRAFEHVAAVARRTATLIYQSSPFRIMGAAVTGEYFAVLGTRAATGRALSREDDIAGAPGVILLSDRLWRDKFSGVPDVVGRVVALDGAPRTVIGVMPASIDQTGEPNDYWVPLRLPASQRENFTPYLSLLGRLRTGQSVNAAAQELNESVRAMGTSAERDGVRPTIALVSVPEQRAAEFRKPLLVMLCAAFAILLIACANVSTLVLARSASRSHELAVRASLGAGRARLVRQLITEHVVLAGLATVFALPIAAGCASAIAATIPAEIPRIAQATLDARAVGVALLLALVSSVLCGLAPAFQLRTANIAGALRGGSRSTIGRRSDFWRKAFVATEVALTLTLLTGAGLLMRSAISLSKVNPGFDVQGVLTARLALPTSQYPDLPVAIKTFDDVLRALRSDPRVRSAALVSRVPLGGSAASIDVGMADRRASDVTVNAALRVASSGYFRSMGIPLREGRDLAETDLVSSPAVAVINESLARRLGENGAPIIGRRFVSDNAAFKSASGAPRAIEIVGVVGDVLDGGLRSTAAPEFFLPMAQVPDEPWDYWIGREMLLVARSSGGSAGSMAPAMRQALATVDGRVPLYDVRATEERLAEALAVERFSLELVTLMGLAALGLAALGIHSVVSYVVGQRQQEAGVRLALGSTGGQLVTLIVRQSMQPILAGVMAGIVGSFVVARAGTALLFGVTPQDPVAFAASCTLMLAVGAVACFAPARRMSRVMPAMVLRGD